MGAMGKRGKKPVPVAERFRTKYQVDPISGCWEWTGAIGTQGYGSISVLEGPWQSKNAYAHRVSYELHKGPIPEGLVVDHMCNNRRCVNPDHLQAITRQANIDRSPDIAIRCRMLGLCMRGHDLTDPANVYVRPDNGRRQCVPCRRLRGRTAAPIQTGA